MKRGTGEVKGKVDKVNKPTLPAGGSAEDVFELVHSVMHLFRQGQYRDLDEGAGELTHMEGKVLAFFAKHPGSTLTELVACARKDKGQLARSIKTLKDQGLLRGSNDSTDRRSVRLEVTERGKHVHETAQERVRKLARSAVTGLSAHERGVLANLLRRVQRRLEAL